ncbi:hypothetical protein A5724_01790 [Mycobacterium sp. ACS1612]|uniref:nuclear transport factor 2 family protein n=1 Tax=Mycobacterium sp. ACS1612 TaxID=1834117 RepID=UPI000800043D|nr:nuclear transport factor 2 family protein [Mycobacterium sp. ACS1612]OBF32118.1 hypothetical protein A5724_01790 [Mycobacterium sp. ACS1612]
MQLWELVARERIRDTLARYNWSGDALRLDELAQTFCEDGELELRGSNLVRGRAAIVDLLGSLLFHRSHEIGLDHYGRYRDVFVPVDDHWLIRHRFVSTDWSAPESTMAR